MHIKIHPKANLIFFLLSSINKPKQKRDLLKKLILEIKLKNNQ